MKVVYLTHRVPHAPDRGDRIRAFHTLGVLKQAGFETYVVALAHDDDELHASRTLKDLATAFEVVPTTPLRNRLRAVPALATRTPLTHVLLDSPALGPALARAAAWKPDVVLAFCTGIAHHALAAPLAPTRLVLDMVDVDSAKWRDLAARGRPPLRWIHAREARRLAEFERRVAQAASATIVITPKEASTLQAIAPGARIVVAGNGVDLEAFRPPPVATRRPDVVFTAVFDYAPNEQGAVWFAREAWPLVRAERPDARLMLVGARPTRTVRGLDDASRGIVVTGAVPDVRPYLWSGRAAIAPLAVARGTQNKVLEALAAGLPVVVTSSVRDGLPSRAIRGCRVADDVQAFARAVVEALSAGPASEHVVAGLDWPTALGPLVEVLREPGG